MTLLGASPPPNRTRRPSPACPRLRRWSQPPKRRRRRSRRLKVGGRSAGGGEWGVAEALRRRCRVPAAADSLPSSESGRTSSPHAPRLVGSSLCRRTPPSAPEDVLRRPGVAASADGWLLLLAARPLRPKRRSWPVTVSVAPNKSANLFARLRGGFGCGVVGWMLGGAKRGAVFLLGRRIPWKSPWGVAWYFLFQA